VISDVVTLSVESGMATVTVDSPPVNALSFKVRAALIEAVSRALSDPEVQGIVLICAGRTFFAGADISEFDEPPRRPDLHAVGAALESASKPVIAAIHGTALGGGLEMALNCHFRVAVPSAQLGLPEVRLGLLPGAGGTQRLPRIVGPAAALEIMAFGRLVPASRAREMGLIDALVEEGRLREGAVAFLSRAIREKLPLLRVRDREDKLHAARDDPGLFDRFRKDNARAFRGLKAPECIIRAVEAAVSLPFAEGIERERELFHQLLASTESAAQRYAFFAEREVARIPDIASETPTRPVRSVGVVGAGTMGGGIAMNFLNIGVPVTIVEQTQDALDRGLAIMRRNYESTVRKGRLTQAELERRMGLLTPALDLGVLREADLVIEAVFENLDLKKQVFARLDAIAAPDAILASNTSFLDLNAIAAATSRPRQVVGMHFFSPANVMRLLEVVRAEETAKEVIATAMHLGRKIGKVAVLSRVCDGFIANRMMHQRSLIANELILRGPTPWDIDRVMVEFGFPMGPFTMFDLVGLDVMARVTASSNSFAVLQALCEHGRWGQKRNGGFYDYDDRRSPSPSALTERIIRDCARARGLERRRYSDREILEQMLFVVVNEGARILEEGVALRASDIDTALINGYAWPVFTGGPMFWADTVGLDRVVAGLERLRASYGELHAPAPLLCELLSRGERLHEVVAQDQPCARGGEQQ